MGATQPTFAARVGQALQGALITFLGYLLLRQLGVTNLLPALRFAAYTWVFVLLAGALLGTTRARPVVTGLTTVIIIVWIFVGMTPLSTRMLHSLRVAPRIASADAVVVLSSRIQLNNEYTPSAQSRVLRGLELLQARQAPVLVISEVPGTGSNLQATRGQMQRLGIKAPVLVVKNVLVTRDEAVAVARMARERRWKRVLLVTSPSHMRRSVLTFKKAGLEALPAPCRETEFNFEAPSGLSERFQAFDSAIHEIVGLYIYRRRGWA